MNSPVNQLEPSPKNLVKALEKAVPSMEKLSPPQQRVAELSEQIANKIIKRYEEERAVSASRAPQWASWSISEEADCLARIQLVREQLNQQRQELLHQTRTVFTVTLIALVIGIVLVFAGVVGIYVVNLAVGTITAAAGIIVDLLSTVVLSLNRETNNRLDTMAKELSVLDRTAIAMHYIGYISDTRKRDQAMIDLIRYLYALPTD